MLENFTLFLKRKSFDIKILFFIMIIVSIVFIITDAITKHKTQIIFDEKLKLYSKKLKNEIYVLLNNKKESTLSMALSLAQDSDLKKALHNQDIKHLKLKNFSLKLRENTRFKNVWFQVIDKEGKTFYRSWIEKRGDLLVKLRPDVAQMIERPHIMSTISTGKFDMTFKSMVPIYDNNEFIGMFEVITHFNSIVKQLQKSDVQSIVLVDKKYKKQLKNPMTNTFIGDYYVANLNANKRLLSYLDNKVEKVFNSKKNYIIDENFNEMIVVYNIPDINNKPMGSIVTFKNLDQIHMHDIEVIEINMTFYLMLFILFLLLVGYYIVSQKASKELDNQVRERTQELDTEKNYMQTILDTNPNIILVLKDETIIRGNKSFFDFFGYKDISTFQVNHNSISDFFIVLDEIDFQISKNERKEDWLEYLLTKHQNDHIVKISFQKEYYYFIISALRLSNKDEVLLTMQDITELKNKDQLLYEQSKMASLGEMIGNIAHQWRQPLSIISTGATGMKIQKEYNILKDEEFYRTCDMINDNAQYLSKTIDDFKNFIKGDSSPIDFELEHTHKHFLNIVDASIRKSQIQIIVEEFQSDILHGYPNELIQCFINIFNNAKDILVEKNDENNRYFFISYKVQSNKIVIEFKDNGLGIDEDIISKIYDPYFTTKYKSQGTGLGLNMTYNLIVNGMKGDIVATNCEYKYNEKDYKGASFKITLPRSYKS